MLALLSRYRRLVSVALLFGLAVYIVVLQDKDADEYNMLDHVLVKITAPVQAFIDGATGALIAGFERYVANRDAVVQNMALRDELFLLKRRIKHAEEIERENHRLLALLNLIDRSKDVRYQAARVIANATSRQWKSLRISAGLNDGVQRGMGVIAELGLVGRVMAVEGGYADVMLLSDTASSIDVIVGRSRARGRLRGFGDANSLNARIDYLTRSAPVEVGDEVWTSGAGVVFPKGILVGSVRSVNRVEHGLYQEVLIEPAVILNALDEVLVVRGFGPDSLVAPQKSEPVPDYFDEDWLLREDPLLAPASQPKSTPAPGVFGE